MVLGSPAVRGSPRWLAIEEEVWHFAVHKQNIHNRQVHFQSTENAPALPYSSLVHRSASPLDSADRPAVCRSLQALRRLGLDRAGYDAGAAHPLYRKALLAQVIAAIATGGSLYLLHGR